MKSAKAAHCPGVVLAGVGLSCVPDNVLNVRKNVIAQEAVKIFRFPHSTHHIIGQLALCGKEKQIDCEYII